MPFLHLKTEASLLLPACPLFLKSPVGFLELLPGLLFRLPERLLLPAPPFPVLRFLARIGNRLLSGRFFLALDLLEFLALELADGVWMLWRWRCDGRGLCGLGRSGCLGGTGWNRGWRRRGDDREFDRIDAVPLPDGRIDALFVGDGVRVAGIGLHSLHDKLQGCLKIAGLVHLVGHLEVFAGLLALFLGLVELGH